MIYLLQEGKLLDIEGLNLGAMDSFKVAAKAKSNLTMSKLCYGKSSCLKKFVFHIFQLEFNQEPDYQKLESILEEALTPCNINEIKNET